MLRSLLYFGLLATLLLALATCGKTEHLQGKALYTTNCANCHMEDGKGLRKLIPPLAGAAGYLQDDPATVVRGIRHGMNGPMVVNGIEYNYPMLGNLELSEFQIVNIVNYINQAWGNDYGTITVAQTRDWLAEVPAG